MAVTEMGTSSSVRKESRSSLLYDPKVRGFVFQLLLVVAIAYLVFTATTNAIENLKRLNLASGFGFFANVSGFDITQKLIEYSASSTYGDAFIVGLLNTLLVAGIGIVLATLLGFVVGIARLSSNFVVRTLATWYVEIMRNIPLLLQLFFWYVAVLTPLPGPRQSLSFPGDIFVNARGLFMPAPIFGEGAWMMLAGLIIAPVAWFFIARWAKARQEATGEQFPVFLTGVALMIGLPFLGALLSGFPITFDRPVLKGFNFAGGMRVVPEFVALLLGLTLYTAAFIGEIVRAGILAIHRGQTEASNALGLRATPTLNLVIIPQAMRVIVPPLTSQYLNIVKNSSLAAAIGYPDLVSVFTGTTLNQTGQAIEVIAVTMLVYLTISLSLSTFMNWYNGRIALTER
ncbi:amino acid ABC transporter permease [Candidatus Raskinella chloraquaticus]|jgi:general L-amino acid transport system permease protein